ncbi:MAG: VWA domain-containing protein, partial [Pirellulales bacterium]
MSLAVPSALILSLIALPILVLYVLKVRLRRIPVSTNMFWKQMFDEKPPRALWRKLRHLVSLLAQLLILALLVFAIADPFFKWQTASARRIVLVMDTSASMQAVDIKPTRFDAARQAALKVLDGVRETDSVAIVSASNRPEVVLGMGGHVPTLKTTLESMNPSDGTASIDQAVTLAKQLIGDHPNGQVIVLTDGCARTPEKDTKVEQLSVPTESQEKPNSSTDDAPSSDQGDGTSKKSDTSAASNKAADTNPASSDSEKLVSKSDPNAEAKPDSSNDSELTKKNPIDVQHLYFASENASNIGITQLQARRSLIDALGYQILVSVQNSSKQPIKCRLEIELNSAPVDVLPIDLQPGQKWSRTLEKTSLEGGVLKASLNRIQVAKADDKPSENEPTKSEGVGASDLNQMLVDDQAWAIVPPRVIQKVLVVSPGNLFLQKVFQANQLVKLTATKELPTEWPVDTIVVCHKLVPEKLPEGKILIIDPESNCDLWQV